MVKYNKKTLTGIYKRVTGAMCGFGGIDIQVHEQAEPGYDPEHKFIQMPSAISFADNDEDDFIMGRGICIHEVSHVLFLPKFEVIKAFQNALNNDPDFHELVNVFADCNNEYKTCQLWPHLQIPLALKTDTLFKKHPEILEHQHPFMQICMRCCATSKIDAKFPKDYPLDLKGFVESTVEEFNKNKVLEKDGEGLLNFCVEIYSKWRKVKEEHKKKEESLINKLSKLRQELGDCIKGSNAKREEELNEEIDELCKKLGKDLGSLDRRLVQQVTGGSGELSEKNLEQLKEAVKERKGDGLVHKGWGNTQLDFVPKLNEKYPYKLKRDERDSIDLTSAYHKGKQINRSLRRLVNLQDDYEKRHRNGRIDLTEIRKQVSACGRIINPDIFERFNTFQRGGEWAISVLCDCSGSMSGEKIRYAKRALATLAYALDGLPNVHYELKGFTTGGVDDGLGQMDLIIKKFTNNKLNINYLQDLDAGAGNMDGFSIRSAVSRLMKYKNLKKILVVISDGQPAYTYHGTGGVEDTKIAVKFAERFGIKTIGIGIEGCNEDTIKTIYPINYFFQDTSELPKQLTNLILIALGQRKKERLIKRAWD